MRVIYACKASTGDEGSDGGVGGRASTGEELRQRLVFIINFIVAVSQLLQFTLEHDDSLARAICI